MTNPPSLLQKLAHDIRTTLYPLYEDIVFRLVGFLPRRISAEALTTLLATFSGLFKHVLIPTGDDHLVEKTWNLFKDILPKCNAETQRATAEVWGTALRRFKLSNRSTLVRLIAASATDIQDACAWIFVVSCKVSHFLRVWCLQFIVLFGSLWRRVFIPQQHPYILR